MRSCWQPRAWSSVGTQTRPWPRLFRQRRIAWTCCPLRLELADVGAVDAEYRLPRPAVAHALHAERVESCREPVGLQIRVVLRRRLPRSFGIPHELGGR